MTASLISGLRKNAVMNLPEPSGSSPPEKPPGMKMVCACFTSLAKRSMESAMPAAERLLMTKIFASAPARSTAFAESNSQFVPGNTGISTRGFATAVFA